MARFNKTTPGTKTKNLAGGDAYRTEDKFEVASIVLTSFLKDSYQRTGDQTLERLQQLARTVDPLFLAKLAVCSRNEHGLRSTSHVLAGEIVKRSKGADWTRPFLRTVFSRVDDITETFSYYQSNFGRRPIPNALKRAAADALRKFDEYQLAKYRGENRCVKLVDVVNMVHPKGVPGLDKLLKGELKNTQTWEAQLSQAGKAETDEEKLELKANAWEQQIRNRKIGYTALLKNIRNIAEQAPEVLDLAIESLTAEGFIRGARIFPFQYLTAMQAVKESNLSPVVIRKAISGLAKALDISVANVPKFPGRTLIALDDSGSMGSESDANSAFAKGVIFAAALYKANDAALMMFSDRARYIHVPDDAGVTAIATELSRHRTSNGTNFFSVFQAAKDHAYDRIIFLSDMQGWMAPEAPETHWGSMLGSAPLSAYFEAYKKDNGVDTKVYSFDLQGLGTTQLPCRNVYTLAGISAKTFDVMKFFEEDPKALLSKIESITFEEKASVTRPTSSSGRQKSERSGSGRSRRSSRSEPRSPSATDK